MPKIDKWDGLHTDLIVKVKLVHEVLARLGFPMMLTDGVRTAEQQLKLWEIGRIRPGSIVTDHSGKPSDESNHQVKADGFGHACDSTFLNSQALPFWPPDSDPVWRVRWLVFGNAGKSLGLRWGGDWQSPHDLPHLELP